MPDDFKKEALDFVREHPTSHLATVENGEPWLRVMWAPKVDDDFTVWYATSASSNKIRHIKSDPNVCAVFYNEAKVIRVKGTAEVVTDDGIRAELWEDEWARYWPNGKEDPDYVLIKINPGLVDYLDLMGEGGEPHKIV